MVSTVWNKKLLICTMKQHTRMPNRFCLSASSCCSGVLIFFILPSMAAASRIYSMVNLTLLRQLQSLPMSNDLRLPLISFKYFFMRCSSWTISLTSFKTETSGETMLSCELILCQFCCATWIYFISWLRPPIS